MTTDVIQAAVNEYDARVNADMATVEGADHLTLLAAVAGEFGLTPNELLEGVQMAHDFMGAG